MIPKGNKIVKKKRYLKIKEKYMKTYRNEVIKPINEDETAHQMNFSSSKRKRQGYVISETDLEFANISLR